jgi:hypothetical protein
MKVTHYQDEQPHFGEELAQYIFLVLKFATHQQVFDTWVNIYSYQHLVALTLMVILPSG